MQRLTSDSNYRWYFKISFNPDTVPYLTANRSSCLLSQLQQNTLLIHLLGKITLALHICRSSCIGMVSQDIYSCGSYLSVWHLFRYWSRMWIFPIYGDNSALKLTNILGIASVVKRCKGGWSTPLFSQQSWFKWVSTSPWLDQQQNVTKSLNNG